MAWLHLYEMSKRDKSIETKKLNKFPELEQDGG